MYVCYISDLENDDKLSDENSKVAMWKFNSLDNNRDDVLTRKEVRQLKREVKKNLKPKV